MKKKLASKISGETQIENFISAFVEEYQNSTVASMTKLESHLEDPRYLEKFEDMFVTTRFYMINQVNEGLRPWEHDGKDIPFDMRQKDIDTVLFFYFLHKDYLGETNSR